MGAVVEQFSAGMFKYLVALVALVVAASGQTVDPLPYQQILDPNFVLSWDYDTENITMEFLFNSNGWGCLYLLSDDGTFLDVIWGGFDEDYGVPYLDDGYAELQGLSPGLRFRRLLDTRDKVDVPIVQGERMVVLWAYSQNDIASSYAQASGISYVTFLP